MSNIRVPYILGGIVLAEIVGFFISTSLSFSCDYHEPMLKVPSKIFNLFFTLESNHPSPKVIFWIFNFFVGVIIGIILNMLHGTIAKKVK